MSNQVLNQKTLASWLDLKVGFIYLLSPRKTPHHQRRTLP